MQKLIQTVANEIAEVLSKVNPDEASALANELRQAKRIFVCGEGRSGLMGKAFAMRLMHGGYQVFVVGETITPSIEEDDLLVAISGSGSTGMIVQLAKKASEIGARVSSVTTNREGKLAEYSNHQLIIPAATKYRHAQEPKTIQPLGNQFDQSVHLLLDAIIIQSLQNETNDEMVKRHANLE